MKGALILPAKIIDRFSEIPSRRLRYKLREQDRKINGEKVEYERLKERLGEEAVLTIRRKRNVVSRGRDPIGYMLYETYGRAKKNNLEFTLEKSDIILVDTCPVLKIPMFKNVGKNGPCNNSWTIDRIDNSKGYTKENIRIISWRANRLKNNATLEELEAIVNYMKGT